MRSNIVKFDKTITLKKDESYFIGLSGDKAVIKHVIRFDGEFPVLEDL